MAYGTELIRQKLGEDLATITVAAGRSFTIASVDVTADRDPATLATPGVQLLAVEGSVDEASVQRVGAELTLYAVDLFAHPGELLGGLERAAADVRNVLERADSLTRLAGIPGFRHVTVVGWEFLEGPDTQRTLLHRIRFRLEVERLYNRGDA